MTKATGLRERKKQQTRQALIDSALQLFEQHGYRKTSIEDITTAAHLAPRTFFLYFASKEDLLFPDAAAIQRSLEQVFTNRDKKTSALRALQQWILAMIEHKGTAHRATANLRRQIIKTDKTLQGREKMYLSIIETLLARELAQDLGTDEHDIRPQIVASAALGVFIVIDNQTIHDLSGDAAKANIAIAIDFLETGLQKIQAR